MTVTSINEELRQTRFRSVSQQAYLSLLRTADTARRHAAWVLQVGDITLQQYNVLRILRGAGQEGLPTLAIGERMIERTPGITRLIDRMEAKGWVRRRRCTEDRRRVWCLITEDGLSMLGELDGPVESIDTVLEEVLDADELAALVDSLDRIRAVLSTAEG